jgi:hypothetical protein
MQVTCGGVAVDRDGVRWFRGAAELFFSKEVTADRARSEP